MQTNKTIAQLFEQTPHQWGLRGDPHLWNEMREMLSDAPYPATEEEFAALIERTYEQLTGKPLAEREPIFIPRHSHGGMSSGYVSPPFWAEKALPLLRAHYRAASEG